MNDASVRTTCPYCGVGCGVLAQRNAAADIEIKGDPDLRRVPVVVLTTSVAEEDVFAAYDLHANAYVRKPVDFDQFVAAVRAIDDFYITVVRLPPR